MRIRVVCGGSEDSERGGTTVEYSTRGFGGLGYPVFGEGVEPVMVALRGGPKRRVVMEMRKEGNTVDLR